MPPQLAGFDPLAMMEAYSVLPVPDPVTFVLGDQWLNKPRLYPRQVTFLKIVFLRDDLFTDYDHKVIAEWIQMFRDSNANAEEGKEDQFSAQTLGIQPDIYERIAWCKDRGYKWFRELILAIGRRGSKGFLSALCMSYVLWSYLAKGNPQDHYGIDQSKAMELMIFAGKKDQAKRNLWSDLHGVITESECFTGSMGRNYIGQNLVEVLSVFAPYDEVRIARQAAKGVVAAKDMATFQIVPRESSPLAARGGAAFCLDPWTPVLKSDLTWVPIRSLRPGDHVIGLDEFPENSYRKMRDSVVEQIWQVRSKALRLVFDDRSEVICSPDHRWLWREKGRGGTMHWREASKLKVGHEIKFLADPWSYDESRGAGYLAGVFDGEGCVPRHPEGRSGSGIHISQNQGPVLDETLKLLKDRGFDPVPFGSGAYRKSEKYLCQQWSIRGAAECMRFLGTIRPPRLMEVANRVWEGTALRGGTSWTGRYLGRNRKRIVEIEELPKMDLIDIQTSTGTFIANGLISHNCFGFDEAAHVKTTGITREFGEVYNAARPALDQFGLDGFVVLPSSTWEMTGMFYQLWLLALQDNPAKPGEPLFPNKLMLQLSSWHPYEDWEIAQDIPLFPAGFKGDNGEYEDEPHPRLRPLRGPIQAYDEEMRKEEMANPDTFNVERRSWWATSLDAYLNPGKVDAIFAPWEGRPVAFGPPQLIEQERGPLSITYVAHGDPATVNHRFGFVCGHAEPDEQGMLHAVIDKVKFWDPTMWEDHMINYDEVDDWIFENVIMKFQPTHVTFDQYNVMATVPVLQKRTRAARLQKVIQIEQSQATNTLNWNRWECTKAAINLSMAHSYLHPELRDELKFLTKPEGQNKVEPPETGPVITNDIADAFSHVVYELLGEQMSVILGKELGDMRPGMAMSHQSLDPFARFDPNAQQVFNQMSLIGHGALARGARPRTGTMPASFTPGGQTLQRRGRHRS